MGMLVLDRDIREGFQIGNDIEIFVLGINKKRARIGINAPKNVSVVRNEIVNKSKKKESKTEK